MTQPTLSLEAIVEAALAGPDPSDAVMGIAQEALRPVTVAKMASFTQPILGTEVKQQIVFCVAIEPDSVDQHGEAMDPHEVEYTAHRFMTHSRIVKAMHSDQIAAVPVESYIAPIDIPFSHPKHGDQVVKKGSWVLGIKVNDAEQWRKVEAGDYTGISVGGFAWREEP